MKRLILTGMASLAMLSVAPGRTDPAYVNDYVQIFNPPSAPPMIDATNFINNVAFIDNTLNTLFIAPFETANTVYYTNFGVLGSLQGFRFDTFNPDANLYTWAGTLHNAGGAIINCGGTNDGPYFTTNNTFFFSTSIDGALCLASATNIINRGTIEMGPNSLLRLEGQNVSLSGGLLNMEGFETGDIFFGSAGMFDSYWGLGQTPRYNPAGDFSAFFPNSPQHSVTNRYYADMDTSISMPQGTAYLTPFPALGPSNYLWQVVFLQNSDPTLSNNVYFGSANMVEWVWRSTNIVSGLAQTNHLVFQDSMMDYPTLALMTNGTGPASIGYRPTYIPTNYLFYQSAFGLGTPATPGLAGNIFPNTNMTSEYTAYEAMFQPTTVIVSELAGQSYSNMPGRIEVTADKELDLRSSRISGLNYVRLTATNNYLLNSNTRLLTAAADFDLGVTNGTMTVSNLLAPTCPRLSGYVGVFSTRWTNINSANITNAYFVTMVDSHLTSTSPSLIQNLTLRAPTNVVISDVLNVLSNITIVTTNLTITTNGPGGLASAGQLIFPLGETVVAALPRLRTLTNNGVLQVQNVAYFGSAAVPYWDFVNHGRVVTLGCSIWATNFENAGLIDAGPGPFNLTACRPRSDDSGH
ncbi:MAG: hypothetical protein NT154_41130 [Verrucomicrobia bacterium]|nr:hypothetical protein [Verrucomicrobiota bacterium]